MKLLDNSDMQRGTLVSRLWAKELSYVLQLNRQHIEELVQAGLCRKKKNSSKKHSHRKHPPTHPSTHEPRRVSRRPIR